MLPSANADAPTPLSTPLSSLLLLAFHGIGESTDAPLAGMVRRVTAKAPAHHPSPTYGLEQKETARFPPVSQSRLRAAASPAFDEALHERLLTHLPLEEISSAHHP